MDFQQMAEQFGIPQRFAKKDFIFQQGQTCRYLYVIQTGVLKGFYSDEDGKDFIKSFLFSGDVIASMAALQGGKASFNLQVLQPCEVIRVAYEDIERQAAQDLASANHMIKILMAFAMKKEQREYELLCLSAQQRYQALLARKPDIYDFVTQGDIAKYLGITPVALSRIIHQ